MRRLLAHRDARLFLAGQSLTALALLPLLAVHDAGDIWLLYAVAVAYGASYTILGAGQSALMTTLVPSELLGTANAALQAVREGLRLVAPLAGSGLYTVAGGGAVALLDAATFLFATCALLAVDTREPRPERSTEPWRRAVLAGACHVKIGHGRHYADVPPITGVYRGGAGSHLSASVRMRRAR